jgi:hypothetical protein
MECPVCANAAAEEIAPMIAGVAFKCPTCGEYEISGPVYETGLLKALEPTKRKSALARARLHVTLGKLPRITIYDL